MKMGRTVVVSAASVLALSAGAAAQPQVQPFLLVERSALSDWLVDEKDAALEQAVAMIPARVHELPGEIPNFPPEAQLVSDMLFEVLAKPGRLAVTYNGANPGGGLFGYGVVFSVASGDQASARSMQENVLGLINRAGRERPLPFAIKDSTRFSGMKDIQFPFGLLSFGPRNAEGKWWYDVAFGSVDDPAQGFEALPVPATGLKPFLRGRVDFEGLNAGVQVAQAMVGHGGGEAAETIISELEQVGLIGEDALKIDFQIGYTANESVSLIEVRGAKRVAEHIGLPGGTLNASDLRAVPGDALMASVAKVDLSQLDKMFDQLASHGVPIGDALLRFKEQTGVDLREDIIRTLGGTAAFYMSDSTGGGGLLSSVAIVSFKDRERFMAAHRKLVDRANRTLEELSEDSEIARYVRLAKWTRGGAELVSLRFNGLPVPFELTYAATRDWLIVGATPQAVAAAVRQASGNGDAGIGERSEVQAAMGGRGLSSLTFMDTPRLARGGYGVTSLVGSALANGVRSPDGSRDPGLIVPLYRDLLDGARATVDVSYWRGDDYVYEAHADRSLLVQGAGTAGFLMQFAPLVGAAAFAAHAKDADEGRAFERAGSRRGLLDSAFEPIAALEAARLVAFIDPAERALLTAVLSSHVHLDHDAAEMVRQWEAFMGGGE